MAKSEAAASESQDTYSKAEIIAAARAFGTTPHVVAGALRRIDKERLTRSEAEAAIKSFLERQV
ncbi:MAG: oligoribonuclease [Alicyclobacillus macrosporangiidus]|uniref:oligoribonuclease n=1 Tax=Alicyclobacillus macrosporangiidus TaxID=392015 RepID=UPI0026EFA6E3|nr:oligoribonuclease [Alicyclobacillus macrosporangiidus]MCL6597943.1 oligoribonuclease [Alicyclobacillus macrosporangiidus]